MDLKHSILKEQHYILVLYPCRGTLQNNVPCTKGIFYDVLFYLNTLYHLNFLLLFKHLLVNPFTLGITVFKIFIWGGILSDILLGI